MGSVVVRLANGGKKSIPGDKAKITLLEGRRSRRIGSKKTGEKEKSA